MRKQYEVYGKAITGLGFGLRLRKSRAKATYRCANSRETKVRAINAGFCSIDKVVKSK